MQEFGIPSEMLRRTGQMDALGGRVVLAFLDGAGNALAQVLERISTWDGDHGGWPYPGAPYTMAYRAAAGHASTFLRLVEEKGLSTVDTALDRPRALVEQYAPDSYREQALAHLSAWDRVVEPDVAAVVAVAAVAAALASQKALFPSQEQAKLTLVRQIRRAEAESVGAPSRERTDVGDDEAVAFLDELLGGDAGLPHSPSRWGLWEIDMVAAVKRHLLETPASATSAAQRDDLRRRIVAILESAAADLKSRNEAKAAKVRPGGQRTQPKKKKPRKGR